MITNYLSSFNSGELSEYFDSRSDMTEKYRSGCRTLENFLVLPYGGVERRTGSIHMGEALSSDVRLFPFDFTEDFSYIIEIGVGTLRVWDSDGLTAVSIASPYTADELSTIKYRRVFDVMYLVCPTKPPYKLSRTDITTLTFTLEPVEFLYPPLLEENTDFDSLVSIEPIPWVTAFDYIIDDQITEAGVSYYCIADHTSTTFATDLANWAIIYQESVNSDTGTEVYLRSTEPIFSEDLEDSKIRLRHKRTESGTSDTGTLTGNDETSAIIFVGDVDYSISIYNTTGRGTSSTLIETNITTSDVTGWVTEVQYNTGGTHTFNGTGATNQRVRVRKYNTLYSSTYEIGADSNRRVSDTFASSDTTEPLDVSFSNWEVSTGGTWNGVVELEKSVDGGATWSIESIILDTIGAAERNTAVTSTAKEGSNTLIRVKYTFSESTEDFEVSLNNQSVFSEGLVLMDDYIDDYTMKGTVVNPLGSSAPTKWWTMSAFSQVTGYPNAVDIFEDRVIYAGTEYDPSSIWMSVVGDYENFQIGTADDEAVKIQPNNAEPTQWLISSSDIFQGSRGGMNNIYSIDSESIITPSTIKSSEVTAFGSANIQAILANDVTAYMQRRGKKLRSIVYNDSEKSFNTEDLTILSNHITGDGIVELTSQKTPDQMIWALRNDGILAGLTYERTEGVAGWHRQDYGGIIKSIAVRPSSGEDELWMAIERDNGTYLEKTSQREFSDDLLDATFVDSSVKTVLESAVVDYTLTIGTSGTDFELLITSVGHGLTTGDNIRFETSDIDELTSNVYSAEVITVDTFVIHSSNYDSKIDYSKLNGELYPQEITVTNAGSTEFQGLYELAGTKNGRPYWEMAVTGYVIYFDTIGEQWTIGTNFNSLYYSNGSNDLPSETYWTEFAGSSPIPTLTYYDESFTGSYIQVSNTWDGLDHLDDQFVQIQGDGGNAGSATVVNGSVTTDTYYNQTVIGLPYVSTLQPMFVEPFGGSYNPMGQNKIMNRTVLKFYRTIGGLVGTVTPRDSEEAIELDVDIFRVDIDNSDKTDFTRYKSEQIIFRKVDDAIGGPIKPYTGEKSMYIQDGWSKLKTLYVVQNIPMPMTVLGMAISINTGKEL